MRYLIILFELLETLCIIREIYTPLYLIFNLITSILKYSV
jgi:hypothetical protein